MNERKHTTAQLFIAIFGGGLIGGWIERTPHEPARAYDLNTACVHYSRGYNIGVEDGFAKGVQATRHDLSMRDQNEPIGCALDALEIEHNQEPIQ